MGRSLVLQDTNKPDGFRVEAFTKCRQSIVLVADRELFGRPMRQLRPPERVVLSRLRDRQPASFVFRDCGMKWTCLRALGSPKAMVETADLGHWSNGICSSGLIIQ